MEVSGSSFEVFEGEILRSRRNSSRLPCRHCLRSVRLFLKILFFVFIAGTIQEGLAERNVNVTEGFPATLNCITSITSTLLQFSWARKDGKAIPQDVLQNNSILLLPSVNRTLAGVYICKYFNIVDVDIRNDTINLIVQYPAEVISIQPPSVEVKPGEDVTLTCIVSAVPPVNTVTWTFNGASLQVSKSRSINLSNVKCSITGIYHCIPSNGLLPTTKNGTVEVIVRDKPGTTRYTNFSSTATSLFFKWTAPFNGCLPLTYTLLYWIPKETKDLYALYRIDVGTSLNGTVSGLIPYTGYNVALETQNDGGKTRSVWDVFTTDVKVPSEPVSLKAISSSCQVNVKWDKPEYENGPELSYRLSYRQKFSTNWTHIENIKKNNHSLVKEVSCSGKRCLYFLQVSANNTAGYGKKSSPINITGLKLQSEVCAARSTEEGENLSDLVVVLVVLATLFIAIFSIIAIICVRSKCRNCKMSFKGLFTFEQATSANTPMARDQTYREKRERESVPYEKFWQHVTLRHADTNYRFSSEFESLQGIQEKNKKLTWIQSQRPENQTKNRFANVVAYDQTRVVLSTNDGIQGSHYINANYVDSYKAMNFYIATQGPLTNTMTDFWRMVWEQNSKVIVMITNIIEKGRHKCSQYWPTKNRKTADYGQLRVTHLREEHFAFYTVREFEIKPIKEGTHYSQDSTDEAVKPLLVQQFHFTGWPDHGVPDAGYEIPVLDFVFKSTAAQTEGAGPIIVHCSAGVGRSGAFIVIDSMIKRIHDSHDLNIFSFLAHIRQQRNHLVQEECQYIFIHDVLLEYITCGFLLSLPKRALKEHLYKIRSQAQTIGKTKIATEFERLKNINIQEYNLKEGQRTCNVNKNRNINAIPVDTCRVKLYPRPGVEGSDYINGSYIDGFWRREAYIATQYPLESTLFDFWRMIWQENCRSIIMLLSKEEWDQRDYPRYLPVVHDTARFGVYEVTMESESARGDFMIRDLKMTSVNEPGETRKIRHFHFIHWPEEGFPWSGQSVLQLVSKVDEWEKEVRSNSKPFEMTGPIVVHCSKGIGRTGVYCILHTLWNQVTREDVVSVYPTARLQFHQRPSFLLTQAQYEFCYDTMAEYIDADCSLYLV